MELQAKLSRLHYFGSTAMKRRSNVSVPLASREYWSQPKPRNAYRCRLAATIRRMRAVAIGTVLDLEQWYGMGFGTAEFAVASMNTDKRQRFQIIYSPRNGCDRGMVVKRIA